MVLLPYGNLNERIKSRFDCEYSGRFVGGRKPGEVVCPTPDWTWAFQREDAAFVENVRCGTQPLAHGKDCLEDMHFLEDVWRHIVSERK